MSTLRYAFFPGCTLESAANELKVSTEITCKKLGIELVEIEGWTCCGASQVQDVDDFFGLLVNARNIALAESQGFDQIMTVCNTCTLMLRTAKSRIDADPALKDKVNEALAEIGLEYKGTAEITHYLWALVRDYGLDRLKEQVKVDLSNLHVANYYGCHILMPPKIMGFENDRNPQSMEMVMKALGAVSVDYEQRLACCGFHAIYPAEKEAETGNAVSLAVAKEAGADCVVTPCPLCHFSLDMWQKDSQEYIDTDITIPVLHLPQVVGLALGFSPKDLAINHHVVSAMPLMKSLGLK